MIKENRNKQRPVSYRTILMTAAVLVVLLQFCGCSFAQKDSGQAEVQGAGTPFEDVGGDDTITFAVTDPDAGPDPVKDPKEEKQYDVGDPRKHTAERLSARQQDSLVCSATIVRREKGDNGIYEHTYFNKEVDFKGLQIDVIEYSFEGDSPALRMKIALPKDWDDPVREWMEREGLRFGFYMGGLPVDAFRQKSVIRDGDGYEVVYSQCLLDQNDFAAYSGLDIIPYVESVETITGLERTAEGYPVYDLLRGDEYRTVYIGDGNDIQRYIGLIQSIRREIENCKLTVLFPRVDYKEKQPVLYPLSVIEILWAENISRGVYKENAQIPELAEISRKQKDFSEVRFVLDAFHIWEDEIQLAFSIYFPESWSDAERMSLMQLLGPDFRFIVDGEVQEIAPNDHVQFFGKEGRKWGGSKAELGFAVNEDNYKEAVPLKEQHYRNWFSKLTVEEWKNKGNLTIVPCYRSYTDIVQQDLQDPILLTSDPIIGNYYWGNKELVCLEELAISIDLTSDLYECGF